MTNKLVNFIVVVALATLCVLIALALVSSLTKAEPALNGFIPTHATALVGDEHEHGTGVVIGFGTILTAGHVAAGHKDMKVTLLGKEQTAHVLWVGQNGLDLAILSADTRDVLPVKINCKRPLRGDRVYTFGYPLIAKHAMTWGRVSSDDDLPVQYVPTGSVLLDMTVAPGNSGGGVFNDDDELVGIVDAILIAPMPLAPFGVAPDITGLSTMIGSPTICQALGRNAWGL